MRVIAQDNSSASGTVAVFVHGLGGNALQWEPQLRAAMRRGIAVLAIDLPGHGESAFTPHDFAAFASPQLAGVVRACATSVYGPARPLFLIGHSMGCLLVARVALGLMDSGQRPLKVALLCAKAQASSAELARLRELLRLPDWLFNAFRRRDRAGGAYSHSVQRMVAPQAPLRVRERQLAWNLMSRTPVWRRTVLGVQRLAHDEWQRLDIATLVIAGHEVYFVLVQANLRTG